MASRLRLGFIVTFLLAWPYLAQGQEGEAELGPEWVAVEPAQLERLRGGFDLPSGLALSFGIERIVQINGVLVATTRFNIADITRMTASEARTLGEVNHGLVVQLGAGNTLAPSSAVNGLVIQNSLDHQDIRTLTTLNVGVNTLGLFQDLNSQMALQNALTTAPGAP